MLYFLTYILEMNMYYIKGQQLKLLNPKEYGLGSRAVIGKTSEEQVVLIKDRESRIIMRDDKKILEQINIIKSKVNNNNVVIATQAPICSKTKKFFTENQIDTVQLKK